VDGFHFVCYGMRIQPEAELFRNKAACPPDFSDDMTNLIARQAQLIETNVNWLRQAITLIGSIADGAFTMSPQGMEPHRAGAHLRHILEFYECFLDGVESGHIDYDARRRDHLLERSRTAAIEKMRSMINRLQTTRGLSGDSVVFVRMEDVEAGELPDPFLLTSVARELQALSSHTIHHFALMAMTLRLHGCEVNRDFGMAPSTLRFRSQGGNKAAAA
jgi:hypothetical protein